MGNYFNELRSTHLFSDDSVKTLSSRNYIAAMNCYIKSVLEHFHNSNTLMLHHLYYLNDQAWQKPELHIQRLMQISGCNASAEDVLCLLDHTAPSFKLTHINTLYAALSKQNGSVKPKMAQVDTTCDKLYLMVLVMMKCVKIY